MGGCPECGGLRYRTSFGEAQDGSEDKTKPCPACAAPDADAGRDEAFVDSLMTKQRKLDSSKREEAIRADERARWAAVFDGWAITAGGRGETNHASAFREVSAALRANDEKAGE